MEAYSKTLSHQDKVEVQKMISGLRNTDKVDGSALKKQVEELRETIRKLENRVDKLAAKSEPAEGEKTAED